MKCRKLLVKVFCHVFGHGFLAFHLMSMGTQYYLKCMEIDPVDGGCDWELSSRMNSESRVHD